MKGKRIAVTGMGRSGVAIAIAAAKRGAVVALYDEKTLETPEQFALVDTLQGHGVDVVPGWHGRFESPSFDLLVTSPGFRRNHPALRDAQAANKVIWSEVEFAYQISEAPIVAVTGTNGKSTTVVMTWLMAGSNAVLCGNLSGSGYPELTLTEAADASTPDQVLIAEISSFQLEWVQDFAPKVAAITNISPDHLDRHPDFADYRDTKLRLFANMGASDTVVVNQNAQPFVEILSAIPSGVDVRFIGDADGSSKFGPTTLTLSGLGAVPLSEFPWTGMLNTVNATMAWELASAALGEEANPQQMVAALKGFRGLANRMERLGSYHGVAIVNNSMCTNPAAVIANSEATGGRQILLMGGVTKELDFSPVRDYLAAQHHEVILFGPDSDLQEQLNRPWPRTNTLAEAFDLAMARAQDGDTVMLSPGCASAAPYLNFRERGDAFRAIVADWLDAHKS